MNKKIAFITEMGFVGKVSRDNPNMRTEFAWMASLGATHHPFYYFKEVKGYDYVVCILPKGTPMVDCQGVKIEKPYSRPKLSEILADELLNHLKSDNGQVCYMQEGPTWFVDNYELGDQILHHNFITQCDLVFCHNECDILYYEGVTEKDNVHLMPTLMIEDSIKDISPSKEEKAIIGGNMSRWYGGFNSYLIASKLGCPMSIPSSHSKRDGEEQLPNLTHLPYVRWNNWIDSLSEFKYAVHLMPTVAAGTFSLNCAYFGIPCLGNQMVDTQRICHPSFSVDVDDLKTSKNIICDMLDGGVYDSESKWCKNQYEEHFRESVYLKKMEKIFV